MFRSLDELLDYLHYVNELEYEQEPDYIYCRQQFEKALRSTYGRKGHYSSQKLEFGQPAAKGARKQSSKVAKSRKYLEAQVLNEQPVEQQPVDSAFTKPKRPAPKARNATKAEASIVDQGQQPPNKRARSRKAASAHSHVRFPLLPASGASTFTTPVVFYSILELIWNRFNH